MVSLKEPGEYKKKVTIDYLHSMYTDHQQGVEELALHEIHTLELAIPKFNTLTTLNKSEFYKFLMAVKKNNRNSKMYLVMVVALADTLTCMIKNSKIYDHYLDCYKSSLDLLLTLLSNVVTIVRCGDVIDRKQLETVIIMLERSAKRIEANEYHGRMTNILQSLKHHIKYQIDKENKRNVENTKTNDERNVENTKNNDERNVENTKTNDEIKNEINPYIRVRNDIFKNPFDATEVKENFKLPVVMTKKRKTEKSRVDTDVMTNGKQKIKKEQNLLNDSESNPIINNTTGKLVAGKGSPKDTVINASVRAVHLKPQNNNKITNAFDFMMMSSKLLAKKK